MPWQLNLIIIKSAFGLEAGKSLSLVVLNIIHQQGTRSAFEVNFSKNGIPQHLYLSAERNVPNADTVLLAHKHLRPFRC